MLLILPALIILLHLRIQLLFVCEVGCTASRHLLTFFRLEPLLCRDDLKELITFPLRSLFNSSIIVCKLLLPRLVQLL